MSWLTPTNTQLSLYDAAHDAVSR